MFPDRCQGHPWYRIGWSGYGTLRTTSVPPVSVEILAAGDLHLQCTCTASSALIGKDGKCGVAFCHTDASDGIESRESKTVGGSPLHFVFIFYQFAKVSRSISLSSSRRSSRRDPSQGINHGNSITKLSIPTPNLNRHRTPSPRRQRRAVRNILHPHQKRRRRGREDTASPFSRTNSKTRHYRRALNDSTTISRLPIRSTLPRRAERMGRQEEIHLLRYELDRVLWAEDYGRLCQSARRESG